MNTAKASKLIGKYFFDLRNMFLNQENIRIFFSKQKQYTEKNFLSILGENLTKARLILLYQENFSEQENISYIKKIVLILRVFS